MSVVNGDQRLASMTFIGHHATTAGSEIVETGITRGYQRCIGIDHQSHAGTKRNGADQEHIFVTMSMQDNSLARSTCVNRTLNACSIQSLLVMRRDHAMICLSAGLQRDTRRGNVGLVYF